MTNNISKLLALLMKCKDGCFGIGFELVYQLLRQQQFFSSKKTCRDKRLRIMTFKSKYNSIISGLKSFDNLCSR